ncbi:MAG: zeta toxin family protein [Planctomycetota bacterium]|jgi:predicted ABC-type ATPase|nr:zeta toxin family protein [Planctomycetota bacterium]
MKNKQPCIIILAGPNGAGKSTTAPILLRDTFAVDEFVNADAIAQGLSAFAPERVALEAGKIMLKRLRELADRRSDFAFETTLASRSFAPWLARLRKSGYRAHLMFLTLPDADFAINRVATRVMLGGHAIDDAVVRRRFSAGLKNFFQLYMPVVSSWKTFDNATPGKPVDIAESDGYTISVADAERFEKLKADYANG